MSYLIDTSALVRIVRRQVEGRWLDLVDRGLVAICDPVLTEVSTIANAKQYEQVERQLSSSYPWVPVPEDAWEIVTTIRRELAKHGVHQALSVADYLVAATAMKRNLVILHEDADFETVSRLIPMIQQERIGLVE